MTTDRRRANTPRTATPRVADFIVEHLAATGVQHIFGVDGANRSGAGLGIDGPSVISVECSADEIPPFAPFLGKSVPSAASPCTYPMVKENHCNVVARA
jgi:acetolactate synthase I/II/III large subunit